MAKLVDDQLKILKSKVHNKEDLRKVLEEYDMKFTEEKLDECYNSLLKDEDLNLDDLDDVNGGFVLKGKTEYTTTKCWKCKQRMMVNMNPNYSRKCPNCGVLVNVANGYKGC